METPSSSSEIVVLDETGSEGEEDNKNNGDDGRIAISDSDKDIIILDEYPERNPNGSNRKRKYERCNKHKRCHPCDHEVQVKRLKKDNLELRSELSTIRKRYNICVGGLNNDLIRVDFKTEEIFKKYKNEIQTFLSSLLSQQNCSQDAVENLFCVDNACNSSVKGNKQWQVPIYVAEYSEALLDKENEDEKTAEDSSNPKPKQTCFNCLGDHMLADCPRPQDRQEIAKNRREYYAKFGGKTSRYHIENDPKFSKYKAGSISNELRKALKIQKHQLPPYIYKMRVLGYPPGWLLEAQVQSSGITMYDSEGKEVIDENLEEGEVTEKGEAKIQYDPTRLVEYPGFNVYPEPGMLDEHEKFGSFPMQEHQLKSYFELHMKTPETRPLCRRKSKTTPKDSQTQIAFRNEEDMEIEDGQGDGSIVTGPDEESKKCVFIPPLPREPPEQQPLPPPPPPQEETAANKSSELSAASDVKAVKRGPSPTLEDLEHQKQHLMLQLQQKVTDDLPESVSTPEYLETSSQDSSTSGLEKQAVSTALTPVHRNVKLLMATSASSEAGTSDSEHSTSDAWVVRGTRSASKTIAFGTPIMDSCCPYTKLPSQNQFSEGITEHLPFENLPDSTGHFERFKGVLKKIREKMAMQLQ